MFIAKCIQDGRRVDLPLSSSFYKLMCTPGWRSGSDQESTKESSADSSTSSTPTSPGSDQHFNQTQQQEQQQQQQKDNDDQDSNRSFDQLDNCSNQRVGSGGIGPANENNSEASRQRSLHGGGEAGLKEAELVLSTHVDEISKDGSPKEEVVPGTEGEGYPWFDGILKRGDIEVVSPFRSRFMKQLEILVRQREGIQGNQQLSSLEKERQLTRLTLLGAEENIPGARVEDLW